MPELRKSSYREVFHYPYRVIYRVDVARVIILTIRHAWRAWDPADVAPGA